MKAIVLFSNGIDSPVAAYLAAQNGIELIGLNFYNANLNEKYKQGLIALAKKTGITKLYFADHSISHKAYREKGQSRFQCVFCKRIMMKIADELCSRECCDFIVTGDNLSQVATQTIPNLKVVSSVSDKKIIRPVLTMDKLEIIEIAKKIGTYNINLDFNEKCPFLPNNPATTSKLYKLEFEESKIDVNNLIKEIIEKIIIVEVD